MGHIDDIIDEINRMAGKYSAYEVFADWVKMAAISISNTTSPTFSRTWKERERTYIATAGRYSREELMAFSRLTGLLAVALEDDMQDVLGAVYMRSGMGSSAAGQFFTPFHLQELVANLTVEDQDGHYVINEPSCGSGGMIIAAAKVLRERDPGFQRKLRVVAQDIDLKGVYMTYLQLSLLGINAACIQGNSLGKVEPWNIPLENKYYTPAWMGLLV